ncbi:MAG: enolase C-terminal domain-like protein [Cypionkella sp.]
MRLRRKAAGLCRLQGQGRQARIWREDRARLSAVRAAVGDDFRDDGRRQPGLSAATRRSAGPRMLAEVGVAWFEEPMPADDV